MTEAVEFDLVRTSIADHPTLVVYGEVDVVTSPRLHEALEQLLEDGPSLVLVDMANVTFIDSSGLGALVVADRHLEERGSELRLVALSPRVTSVLEAAGLTDRFQTFDLEGPAEDGER